jgi:hypothetical protein
MRSSSGSVAAYVPTAPERFERPPDAPAVAVELERPARELQPEGGRLGVDAVRSADLQGAAVLLGPDDDGGERPVDLLEDQRARLPDLEREGGVDDVG